LEIMNATFSNNKYYSISVESRGVQRVAIDHVTISGDFEDGIRFFGPSLDPDVPKIEDVVIISEASPGGIGIYISDNQYGAPQGKIINTHIANTDCAIFIIGTENPVTVGPDVQCHENYWAGIIVEDAVANIVGTQLEPNAFIGGDRGIAGVSGYGKVRWTDLGSNVLGGDLVDCNLDFGFVEPDDPGMNSFAGDLEMFLYVMDSPDVYAQRNWWGTTDLGEIYEKVTEYVIVEPILPGHPFAKLGIQSVNLPNRLMILKAYPNPFNADVTIELFSPISADISLKVYNILGQEITEVFSGRTNVGNASVVWDGRDQMGNPLASGVYFCIVRAADQTDVKKLMLLK
jgi:hypothetical protein